MQRCDGSLTLYIQHEAPEGEKRANWIPAPTGPFFMAGRFYGLEASLMMTSQPSKKHLTNSLLSVILSSSKRPVVVRVGSNKKDNDLRQVRLGRFFLTCPMEQIRCLKIFVQLAIRRQVL
jgi:hypothetical protein